MSDRERLPNRRPAEIFDFEHGGRRWTATFGRFSDGRLAEVFLDTTKESAVAQMASDSGIIASLALQTGCPVAVLRHALAGHETGPLAKALALAGGPEDVRL